MHRTAGVIALVMVAAAFAPAAPAPVAAGSEGILALPLGELERGNRLFRDGRYAEAVEAYREALEDGEDSPILRYNLGTALLRLGRYEEAEQQLRAALDVVEPDTREWVYYNLGHRFLEDARLQQDPEASAALYGAAVESYRQALRLQPSDADAKWNYELALRERDQQQQQAGGGGGGEEDEQDEQEQQAGQGSGGEARGQPQDAPSGGQGDAQAPMSREQAERILSAIEQDERELFRDRLQRGQRETRVTRDW